MPSEGKNALSMHLDCTQIFTVYAGTNTRLSLDKVVLVENVAINAQVQTLKWNGF